MRAILLILIVIGILPIILAKPHVGILAWNWFAFMNPHRLTWGATYDFGFAQVIAGVTIAAWLISREPKLIPITPITSILMAFVLWMSVTTFFALDPDPAFEKWNEVMKIMIFIFITIPLINTKERLNALVWVIAVSVAFYGVKGGVWVILTGGNWSVLGPPGSDFEGNNALARALVMVIPLLRYLQLQTKSPWIVYGIWVALALLTLSIFSSYSRGGILAFGAMAFVFWIKSRQKLAITVIGAVILVAGLTFMPDKWYDRMASIQTYESDRSPMDRIKMWKHGFAVAVERPLVGGGFDIFKAGHLYPDFGLSVCEKGADIQDYCVLHPRASHSAYFDALGEHGFVGLALFLALGIATLVTGSSVIRRTRSREDLAWAGDLAGMLQVAVIGYAAGAIFANSTYFDLYYNLVVIMIITQLLVTKAIKEQSVTKRVDAPVRGGTVTLPVPIRTDR